MTQKAMGGKGKKKNHSLFLVSILANHYNDRFRETQTTQSQYVAINLTNNFTAEP